MIGDILELRAEVERLKTLIGNMIPTGTVAAVDPVRGYRLKLGDGPDGPYLSPFYPHPESGKSSSPLKVGQIAAGLNPAGDPRQGFLVRGGYGGGQPSPNADMDANVFEDAGVRISVAGGSLTVVAGGTMFVLSAAGFTQTGGNQMHDGVNIGATHVHGGVTTGPADTAQPK